MNVSFPVKIRDRCRRDRKEGSQWKERGLEREIVREMRRGQELERESKGKRESGAVEKRRCWRLGQELAMVRRRLSVEVEVDMEREER